MSSSGPADIVILDIHRKLEELLITPSNPSIHRIDSHYRIVGQDNIYDPEIISIGPYHHGNPRLQNMEELKYLCLKRLLERRNEVTVDRYVNAVAAMEIRARRCYAEPINLDRNQFVKLLVLDGIFITELLSFMIMDYSDANAYLFRHQSVLAQLRHDILLLENQIPFFILNLLFKMANSDGNESDAVSLDYDADLIELALGFFNSVIFKFFSASLRGRINISHLFGLIHDSLCRPFAESMASNGCNINIVKFDNVNSVSGVGEAGIKFRKADAGNHLMDIKFVKGVLTIPNLLISDETESLLRNLIVYEQYSPRQLRRYVSDYTFFIYCLIKTPNDVRLLRERGIISNFSGHDEDVCQMFSRLGRNVMLSNDFCYAKVFSDVNRHCLLRANRWKANLRRNYFNSPWSITSFLAAAALLILTFTQTVFAVFAYYNRKG